MFNSWLKNHLNSFLDILCKVATVYMSDEDMDNFVFAIYPKRTAGKMQKELQDLVCDLLLLSDLILQTL